MEEKAVKVLLIEDNPGDALLVQELLADVRGTRFLIEHVDRLQSGLDRLDGEDMDVVLLDLSLPDSFGLDTFLRMRSASPQTPVVLLTELDDETLALRAVREGAQDYLVKSQVDSILLGRTLNYAIERKAVTEQLRLQNKALEAAANAIVITDREGDIFWANPAFTRLTGYTLEEVIGQNPRILKSGQQVNAFYQNLWDTILAGRVWQGILINKRKDDTLYTEEMTITPVRDWQGEISHFVAIKQDVTERRQWEEALAWESGVNAAIAELSQLLISSVASAASAPLNDISDLILEQAKLLTGSSLGFVGYIHPKTGDLISPTLSRDAWKTCEVADKEIVFHTFRGMWGWVLQNHASILSNDLTADARSSGVPEGHVAIHRFLSAPAMLGDKLVGQIALANPGRDYVERDLDLVERLASLYALAIQHQRSEEEIRDMNSRLTLVNQISRRISGILDVNKLLETVVHLVQSSLDYHHVSVGLVEEDYIIPKANQSRNHANLKPRPLHIEKEGIVGWVIENRQPLYVPDVREDPRYVAGAPEMQTLSELAVPIQHGDEVLGVLNLESNELNAFSEGDEILIQAIADQVAMALDNARLFQEVKVQRDEAMAVTETLFNLTDQVVSMNRVATALLSTNDLDEVARRFVESLRDEMGVQKSGLWMVDGDLMRLAAAVGLPEQALSEVWGEDCKGKHCPALLEVGQAAKYLRRRQFTGETCCDLYFDDWFMLPVRAHNEVLGVLVTEAGALEEDTLRMFINQAALGLSAARAYRRLSEQAEVLARTNTELARAIQSKTNLLNFMSHEVRNPLTAIIGFAKLLQKERVGPLNKKQSDFIARILTGSQHMASLVSEVLDLSKAEAGKLSIHIEPTPVTDILTDAVNIVSGRAAEKNIKIEIDAPDSQVLVQADPTRLRQVLLNLLTNAIKFTGKRGEIVVGAAAQPGPEREREVVIWVSDTGIGIKEKDFPKVFGEFDQIENEQTRSEVGTGLGLPLTKELVELHHGRIWFESTYGEGTTFFVALPAARH